MRTAALSVLLALVFGGIRHARLTELQREVVQLNDPVSAGRGGDGIARSQRESETARQAVACAISPELVSRLADEFAVRMRLRPSEPGRDAIAVERALVRELAQLDRHGATELLDELRAAGAPATGDPGGLRDYCLSLFAIANPPEALALLEGFSHLKDCGSRATDAFKRWALHRPGEAIAWFEGQEEKGGVFASEPQLIQELIKTQCRIDPSKAMERIHSTSAEAISRLGQAVATGLRSGREHQEFLSALERAEDRFPESTTIQMVRNDYVERLTQLLPLWPFDEAALFVNTGFRSDEREKLVQKIAEAQSLGDPAPWADWLVHGDSPPGSRHPVVRLIARWAEKDPEAASDWLGKMPAGALHDEAAYAYAGALSLVAPESAAIQALTIGDETSRNMMLKQILIKWRGVDPEAAAAFFKSRGIGE